jgi:6-phosphogluconolactonase/glucosamine-6-phosphate isomerase/deaminase
MISNSGKIKFLVTGKNKAEVIYKILKNKSSFPIEIQSAEDKITFLLDKEASAYL